MHEAPLPVQPYIAAWPLGTFLVCVITVAGLIAFLRHAARRSWLSFALGLTAAFLVFCFVIKGVRTVDSVPEIAQHIIARPVAQNVEPESTEVVSTDIVRPDIASSAEVNADSSAKASLPEWTQRNPIRDGERRIVVIKGGRFASEEEAELHALDQATIVATQEFRQLDPQGQATRLPIHRGIVVTTAIKKRFLEVREHDFGKSKGLMYQVWLQLELSPDLGDRIAAPWREAAVNARIRLLAGSGIWLTAVLGLIAFAFRWDSARQGRNRTAVFVTVVIVAAGSLLLIA